MGGSSSRGRGGGSSSGFGRSSSGFRSSGSYRPYPPPPPRPPRYHWYNRPYRRTRTVYYNTGRGSGCATFIATIIVIVVLVIALQSMTMGSFLSGITSRDITPSTIERVPLPKGSVNETDYYTDNNGWIGNETALLIGLKNFYNKTGVQPYLYITDSINGNHYPDIAELTIFTERLYDDLFTDEAHLLVVFFEYEPNEYGTAYVAGSQAKAVIDKEAADILLDYLDRYYYYDLSDEQYFSKSFNDAAEKIMKVDTPVWVPVAVVAGVIVLALILYNWWKKAKAQKNREAEMNEKILNTPLDQFGDTMDGAEELGKKYED